ncbi:MAG: UDP-glucose/GDP-mannose dehydrogenase family protein [Desulfarculaceae bacterium]|nr:UDP-glucose/GDP-mannose dehydrogenase family protein [Desulfarculaceae bacterium]MCF8072265.1 UDP-glucose/GDP-mannose dehydrogenase family protein [Desulfarculaceae bacterium]MCF8100186.1 UDP-glucose/GDP-mannose dehydrogenase family protein [Desulfarculaceae bacterium]MCF8117870.1 UDP-glucose/GDP-mannose dehydrogenase family protein [Desulfarculaceae bacterium]
MNICMVGVGYVGLVTGACFAEFGINVTCVDKVPDKIDMLKNGKVPIYEPGLEELVAKNMREGRLNFTTDLKEGLSDALVIFIAVGTPQGSDGAADLHYVEEVAKSIGQTMTDYLVVVTKSTVPVGTGQKVAAIIREHQKESIDFDVVSNPEFLREGSAIEDFMRPNRVVVGADSQKAQAIMRDLYAPLYLIETPFVITNVETAEMIKYASNAFLATKISFINEMANIAERVGADVNMVAKGMGLDRRIGPKFLHAGPGFGGSCFPKDTEAIAHIAREHGYEFKIVDAVVAVNRRQRAIMTEKILQVLGGSAEGKTVACLGLTFKPNTDDMREAPSLGILPPLMEQGAVVRAYDPAGMDEAAQMMPGLVACENAYHAAEGADCLVLMTEWNQFRNLDWDHLAGVMQDKVVVDLRNVYNPVKVREKGFAYHSVGRP